MREQKPLLARARRFAGLLGMFGFSGLAVACETEPPTEVPNVVSLHRLSLTVDTEDAEIGEQPPASYAVDQSARHGPAHLTGSQDVQLWAIINGTDSVHIGNYTQVAQSGFFIPHTVELGDTWSLHGFVTGTVLGTDGVQSSTKTAAHSDNGQGIVPNGPPDATDIVNLEGLRVGEKGKYQLVGTDPDNDPITWAFVSGENFAFDSISGDLMFGGPTGTTYSALVRATAEGGSDEFAKPFSADVITYVTSQLQLFCGTFCDGRTFSGTADLGNGHVVPFDNNVVNITPDHLLEEGAVRVNLNGNMWGKSVVVYLQDGQQNQVEVVAGTEEQRRQLLALMHMGGVYGHCDPAESEEECVTRRWESENAPSYLIDDNGHLSRINGSLGVWTRFTGDLTHPKLQLKADDIADIQSFVQDVFPHISSYSEAQFILGSVDDSGHNLFQGDPSGFPQGFVYSGGCDWVHPLVVERTFRTIDHAIQNVTNCMFFGADISTGGWFSYLIGSLGYHTDDSNIQLLLDPATLVLSPFAAEAKSFFYSPQRPGGSGRKNGFDDYVNNDSSPIMPHGPIPVSF